MAGGHSSNKTPVYYDSTIESEYFRKLPKHVLYALVRDYATENLSTDPESRTGLFRIMADIDRRTSILKANGLIA